VTRLDPLPPEPLFKVGDRVVLKSGTWSLSAKPGATATVTADYREGVDKWVQIKWDRTDLWGRQMDGAYEPDLFEPYTAPLFVDGDMVAMLDGDRVVVRVRRAGKWYFTNTGGRSVVGDEIIAGAMSAFPDSYWRIDTTKPQAVSE
jgi:hypothetical protein